MERIRRNHHGAHFLFGTIIAAWLFCVAFGYMENHAVFQFPKFSIDNRILEQKTDTTYRYPDKFENTLNQYPQFQNIYQEEMSTAIPGLEYTNMGNVSTGHMVPQGICLAEDYMLITAYDSEKAQNSVIYILEKRTSQFNKNSKEYESVKNPFNAWKFRTTIVLPDKNHVGGITFDGNNIWIAKNTTGYLSRISMETIEQAVSEKKESFILKEYEENVYCGVTASFVTWYGDRLWVGTYNGADCDFKLNDSGKTDYEDHNSETDSYGTITSYSPITTYNGTSLVRECTLKVPVYAQGITFIEDGEKVYMLLSTSYGRFNDSQIYLYEAVVQREESSLRYLKQYSFPPMAEEIVSNGEYTYILFESAATCYSTEAYRKCEYPVDRVCALSNRKLLEGI